MYNIHQGAYTVTYYVSYLLYRHSIQKDMALLTQQVGSQ